MFRNINPDKICDLEGAKQNELPGTVTMAALSIGNSVNP